MENNAIKAVLFDLDGTLLDTAADMVGALNELLQQHGRPILPFGQVRNSVSKGSLALVRLGFGDDLTETQLKQLQTDYLQTYSGMLCRQTRPFDGMPAILDKLENAGVLWGVVTNKPGWLTESLLQQLGLQQRAACVISGDTLPRRKPHPDPLLLACQQIQCPPPQCIYIGDDRRDVEAGKAAGMQTLVVEYGYIDIAAEEDPRQWGADVIITDIAHLQRWLEENIL